MGHTNPEMGHTIATNCKERGFRVENKKWRSRQDAENRKNPEQNQRTGRDTPRSYGRMAVNGLRDPLGHNLGDPTKENAASSAKDSGVKWCETDEKSHHQNTPKPGGSAMSKWAKSEHKKVARCVGYALTLGTEAAWHGLTVVLIARLSDRERAALAFAALMSLSDEHAAAVAEVAA